MNCCRRGDIPANCLCFKPDQPYSVLPSISVPCSLRAKMVAMITPKKIVVLGGGPAGMATALSFIKAGFKVKVYERDRKSVV